MNKSTAKLLSVALAGAMTLPAFTASAAVPKKLEQATPVLNSEEETQQLGAYTIQVNGEDTKITTDVMVPLEPLTKVFNFKLTEKEQSLLINTGTMYTEITMGVDSYILVPSRDGVIGTSAPFSFGTAPFKADGVTYIPLGLLNVLLDNHVKTIKINDNKLNIETSIGKDTQGQDALVGEDEILIPSPFVEYETMDIAQREAGFQLMLPKKMPIGYTQKVIQVIKNLMIEVRFDNHENTIVIRKAKGNGDISGDYNKYKENKTVYINQRKVTLRGNNNRINVATWNDGDFAYSISANIGENGLDIATMKRFIKQIF